MMRVLLLALLACLSLAGRAEAAGCPPLPYVFIPGTVADANQVNANFNTVTACAAAGTSTVANTVALRAACTSTTGCLPGHPVFPSGVTRLTDGVAGAPPLYFSVGSGACSTDDGASCVNSSNGASWIGVFSPSGADIREWGTKCDGVTNDATAVQNAITASANGTLLMGNCHALIATPLTSTAPITILGANGNGMPNEEPSCLPDTAAFITNSNINLLTLAGATATVRGVCFQGGTAPGLRTSGTLLTIGSPTGGNTGRQDIGYNLFINGYDCLQVGGVTNGSTQTNGGIAHENEYINCSDIAMSVGRFSTGTSTNDWVLRNNKITCAGLNGGFPNPNTAVGAAIYDGGYYYHADAGPFACNIGTEVVPGANQTALGALDGGVLGDTSYTNNLLINATASTGIVFTAWINGCWIGMGSHENGSGILIENTGGGSVHNVSITGCFLQGNGSADAVIDIENNVWGVAITGNQIVNSSLSPYNTTGVLVNTSGDASGAAHVLINDNLIGQGPNGTFGTGIQLAGTGDFITITGNDLTNSTTAIDPAAIMAQPTTFRATIESNMMGSGRFEWAGGILSKTCTGLGSTGTCVLSPGSNTGSGTVLMTAGGTGILSVGAFQTNVAGGAALNKFTCSASLTRGIVNGTTLTDWPAGSYAADVGGSGGVGVFWNSNGSTLTSGGVYGLSYVCQPQ